ncbi:MAG: helical backbone metal receptor [Acidobacteriota bacterium]|nr:helical backbone metal receptor [Acidobacteriota bacterium]MDQ5873009.1 helical backbone metal receptor [Acidobacteriota bacterium]
MPPRRVVSLCPSITETLVAIGGLRLLVAATRFCVRPEGLLWGLPRIGGTKNPDIGRILDLAPDLVFANEEENRIEDVEALRAAGIDVDVSFPRRVDEVPGAIRGWGKRLGEEGEAAALAGRIEVALAALTTEPVAGSFRYAYWIWRNPWMTVSGDTYVSDLLALAGGVNVYSGEADRYPVSTPEEALARGAKVHLFPTEPFPFREEKHGKEVESLFGTSSRRLFVAGDDLCWHGVRTLDGLRAARKLRVYAG